MFGTFVHILKTDSVLGLYSGVCFSPNPRVWSSIPRECTQTLLISPAPALRLSPPPTDIFHHPLRHLLRAQRYLHDRALLPFPPLLNRHGQHFRLLGRNSRQPSRRTQRTDAARCRLTRRKEEKLQERRRWTHSNDEGGRLEKSLARRLAEQHESRTHDRKPTRQLRQYQTRFTRQHLSRRQSNDAFHIIFTRRVRGDDSLQPRRRDQDARHERQGDGKPARAAEPDRQERGRRVGVQRLGA